MFNKPKILNYKTKLYNEDGINVMRPSRFGNPFIIPSDGDRDEVCDKYETYVNSNPELIAAIKEELRGKNLLCCCAPKRCHAETLLRIANEPNEKDFL